MAEATKKITYERYFNAEAKRHFINKTLSVLHCHHYTSLYCQLAIDAEETALLQESARESFKNMLHTYFTQYCNAPAFNEKVDICTQYFALIGLGKMCVLYMGEDSGEIELLNSHTDSGWLKKWGKSDKPINYIAAGFIEAMFELCIDTTDHAFQVTETESIVMGAKTSKFKVTRS